MKRFVLACALFAAGCSGGRSLLGDGGGGDPPADAIVDHAADLPADRAPDLPADPPADPGVDETPPPPSCAPQEVALDPCMVCGEAVYLGAFWDGARCFDLVGCGCTGPDCGRGEASPDACKLVHERCDGARCRSTGGIWFPAFHGTCGFACGRLLPAACESPVDACRCRPGETFVHGEGCRPDATCSMMDLCLATMGTWYAAGECYCGFTCGSPNACGACLDSCDCGPTRTYVAGRGCAVDPTCQDAPAEEICRGSGGQWREGTCGDYFCGHPNLLDPCVVPGCDCDRMKNFDPVEGCRYDEACAVQHEYQECWGWSSDSTCRAGLRCCAFCVYGCLQCVSPCCPGDESCMSDGCPIPPP
jgi:hypothetical protein